MQHLRIYDYLALARGKLFNQVRPLTAEQCMQQFPVGLGSLGRILTHIMICEWFYVQRIEQRAVPPYSEWPIQDEQPPAFAVIEKTWTEQSQQTRASLEKVRDWAEVIEYRGMNDDGSPSSTIISATKDDLFTQMVLHEVHHRAQVMNILRQLSVKAEDVDFNTLMYSRREDRTTISHDTRRESV